MVAHHPVTRMVHMLSAAHVTRESVRAGKTSIGDVARSTILAREHFPKFLALTMTLSCFAGYLSMEAVHQGQVKHQDEMYALALQRDQSMSRNRAAVNAMVENARSSSWNENLENASAAQDRFMFGSNAAPQRLMKRITSQANEVMRARQVERQSY